MQKLVRNPGIVYNVLAGVGLTDWVPDELHLALMYKASLGNWPNLKHPRTFNEKLQWLKIHDRNPLYTTLVDKYRVKKWVADRIGEEHVTKTYGAWEKAEDIDISGLPERFVLKTNHDCGGVAICRDRESFDLDAAKKKLEKHLRTNYFWRTREWPYKDVKPLVFAEEYLEPNNDDDLSDYKMLCFNGSVDCVMLCTDRSTGSPKYYFLDRSWGIKRYNTRSISLPSDYVVPKPEGIDEMFRLAENLSKHIPFVRVDFYNTNGHPIFGEMTFFPQGGFDANILLEADYRWGEMIDQTLAWDELLRGGSRE